MLWGRQIFANDLYPWLGHGLPYLHLASAAVLAFLLTVLLEILFQYLNLPTERRAVVLIIMLGTLTISSTLWLAFTLSEIRPEFPGLLSVFAINALLGAGVVWLGIFVGSWLWQLNLSR